MKIQNKVQELAQKEKVEIKQYDIIYECLSEVKDAMMGMIEPERVERVLGKAEVRRVFKISRLGAIAGSLAAGFLVIPALGLQRGMLLVAAVDVAYAMVVLGAFLASRLEGRAWLAWSGGLGTAAAAFGFALLSLPPATWAVPPRSADGLRPTEPIRCMFDEDIEIHGGYISTDGNGVEANGNCDVEIYDSYIEAAAVGVLADGNSDVELYNTYVEGGSAALLSQGNSDITTEGSRIVGGTAVRGK